MNDNDSYEELRKFIYKVSESGNVNHFIVHARKAVLNANFSPHDNRNIPPLKYDYVYRLVDDFPHLSFTINGGINSIAECKEHLSRGVAGIQTFLQYSLLLNFSINANSPLKITRNN